MSFKKLPKYTSLGNRYRYNHKLSVQDNIIEAIKITFVLTGRFASDVERAVHSTAAVEIPGSLTAIHINELLYAQEIVFVD